MKSKHALWTGFLVFFLVQSSLIQAEAPAPFALSDITVPESLGKISERHEASSERWIIQIQDIHANYLAQENISAIVEHLRHKFGVSNIGIEGGWSEASFPKSRELPASKEKRLLARTLMQEAYIGGPVHAALFAKTPIQIIGLENTEIYHQNLNTYLKYIERREATLEHLEKTRTNLDELKQNLYNPELYRFGKQLTKFREGHKAELFLPDLVAKAHQKNVDLTKYPQVRLFSEVMQKEKGIEKEKLDEEAQRLMQKFKDHRLSFEEILRHGKIDEEKIQYYPQTKKYQRLLLLQDEMNHQDFFREIDRVIEEVIETLFESEKERELFDREERFQVASAIIQFKATPDDIHRYEAKSGLFNQEMTAWGLMDDLSLALEFYETAKKRDDVFFEKLKTDRRLHSNAAILVGGFHTKGLNERLKAENISYIVITPEMDHTASNEELYMARLQDHIPQTQALAHEKNRYAFLDDAFHEAVGIFKTRNNVRLAVDHVTTFDISEFQEPGAFASNASLTFETFTQLSEEERHLKVQGLFEKAKTGTLPITLVFKSSVLKELIEGDPDGLGNLIWETLIAPERANRILIIQNTNDYLDGAIGTRARIEYVHEDISINEALEKRLRNQKNIAVIDPDYLKEQPKDGVLALPAHPASLLLARVMLEQGTFVSTEVDFLNALSDELENILKQQAFAESA